ncbi:MAG: thiamine-binding protein [Bacillota bacterium]
MKDTVKANIAIKIMPNSTDEDEIVRIVDEVIDYIKSTGLTYYVGPSETAIEGDDIRELMEVAIKCHEVAIQAGTDGVSAYIKTDYKPGGSGLTIDKKLSKYRD